MENNFNSLDRLLEIGMGLAVAQQMMRTMNTVMAETVVPKNTMPAPQMPQASAPQYYFNINDGVAGPFSEEEIAPLMSNGTIKADTLAWAPGMQGWKYVKDDPRLYKLILLNPNK